MKTNNSIIKWGTLAGLALAAGHISTPAQTSPPIQWEQSFGGSSAEYPAGSLKTSDGGYLLSATSNSGISGDKSNAGFGDYDVWVVKVDARGRKQWDKSFGGSGYDAIYVEQQTSDGGYILGGGSYSGVSGNKSSPGFGSNDYWIVKIDANGSKQWDKSYGGNGGDAFCALVQTSDGGYLLGATSDSGVSGNKTSAGFGSNDFWLVKIDANGNKQWDKSFGGSNDDYLTSLQKTADGGYILGGNTSSGVSGNKTSIGFGDNDAWVVKVDANGNKQWDTSFGGSAYDGLSSLQQTPDGGYIIGGDTVSDVSGNKTSPSFGGGDCWVAKLDANGNKLWDQTFGGDDVELFASLQVTRDGGSILNTMSFSTFPSYASGNKTSIGFGGYDAWVVKIDANGNKQWDQCFGGFGDDGFGPVEEPSDGGYLLIGSSTSGASGNKTSQGFGDADLWVVKIGLPSLTIDRSGTNAILSWPSPSTGFGLEQNVGLGAANWTSVTQIPGDDGTTKSVPLPATNSRFYRLKYQYN